MGARPLLVAMAKSLSRGTSAGFARFGAPRRFPEGLRDSGFIEGQNVAMIESSVRSRLWARPRARRVGAVLLA
jgi:hypothetical protein